MADRGAGFDVEKAMAIAWRIYAGGEQEIRDEIVAYAKESHAAGRAEGNEAAAKLCEENGARDSCATALEIRALLSEPRAKREGK